jgi:hypothetical protein
MPHEVAIDEARWSHDESSLDCRPIRESQHRSFLAQYAAP